MAETAGTAGPISAESPVTSDDIAAFASAGADSSPASPTESVTPAPATEGSDASGITVPETSAGPLPYERHKAILEKARAEATAKAREDAEREYRSKYGWAERYQPQEVEMSSRLYQWLQADPRKFMEWLGTQIGEPVGRSAAPPQANEPPAPDLRAEDGTPVYSAQQLQKFMEWREQKLQSSVESIQRKLADREEKDKARQTAWTAKQSASGLLKYAREKWPAFKDLEPDVLKAMQDNPRLSFHDAYIRVFSENGTPKLREQWSAEYQGTLATKQNASTAPPGRPTGTPKKYTEMDTMDVVKQEWEAMSRKR